MTSDAMQNEKFKKLMSYSVSDELEKVNSYIKSMALKREMRNSGALLGSALTNPLKKKNKKNMNVKFTLPEIE